MDWRLRLPGALYRRARDQAGSDTALADRVRAYLTAYVEGTTVQAKGGHARAAALDPEARSASAQRAAQARWHKPPE